jgi:deoxyadenosine/deoxycytidine kinase
MMKSSAHSPPHRLHAHDAVPANRNDSTDVGEFAVEFVTVTGAIGSGKSTLLSCLQRALAERDASAASAAADFDVLFAPEPVDQWQDDAGLNWLQSFYAEPTRWALGLQLKILQTQIAMQQGMDRLRRRRPTFVLSERSPWDGAHVFMDLQREDGTITPQEHALYHWYASEFGWRAALCFHVRADPATCVARVARRSRASETGVAPHYLHRVCAKYDAQMAHVANVVRLDNDTEDVAHVRRVLVPQVLRALQGRARVSMLPRKGAPADDARPSLPSSSPPPCPCGA